MKTNSRLLAAFFLLCLFPCYSSSQTLTLTWLNAYEFMDSDTFRPTKAEDLGFFKTPNGVNFRSFFHRTIVDDERDAYVFIQKLNEDLGVEEELTYGLSDIAPNTKLCDLFFADETITLLACYLDKRSSEVVIGKVLIDSDYLEVESEFDVITRIKVRRWQANYPSLYPITTFQSADHQYALVSVRGCVEESTGGYFSRSGRELVSQFALDSGMNIIHVKEEYAMGDLSFGKGGILHGIVQQPDSRIFCKMNLETGEKVTVELDDEYIWWPWSNYQQAPIYYTFKKNRDGGVFGLLDPENIDEPLFASLTTEHLKLFSSEDDRLAGNLSTQSILDVFQDDSGNYIVTTEFSIGQELTVRALDLPKPASSSTLEKGNIVTFCMSPEGKILWIQSIPKYQRTNFTSRISAFVFRTESGIHCLYNDGEENLKLEQGQDDIDFQRITGSSRIVAHSVISNEGEITKEIFYRCPEDDRYWLWINSCYQISDREIYMRMKDGRREKIGFLTIEE